MQAYTNDNNADNRQRLNDAVFAMKKQLKQFEQISSNQTQTVLKTLAGKLQEAETLLQRQQPIAENAQRQVDIPSAAGAATYIGEKVNGRGQLLQTRLVSVQRYRLDQGKGQWEHDHYRAVGVFGEKSVNGRVKFMICQEV